VDKPIESYWQIRLGHLKASLEANHFEVFTAQDASEAKRIVLEEIIPATGARTFAFGGSMTVIATGLYHALKENPPGFTVVDTFDRSISPEALMERRRQALLVDMFVMGTNAVTETGHLVNLDMIGNRVGALTFGPKSVVVLVGRNKLVTDIDDAMFRIKNYAAPVNAMRLDKKTPCVKTSACEDCNSPDRICNSWVITEKSFPRERIKVVLINQEMGF
jgi:L-lactate utilization protein LutB